MENIEMWDILDDNGNFTGETLPSKEAIERNLYHKGVDVWIINSSGEFLMQKRSATKRYCPNKWAMTGGCSLSGEDSITTIQRECKEELNININPENLILLNSYFSDVMWMDTYLLKMDVDINNIQMQEEEVSEIRFIDLAEIKRLHKMDMIMPDKFEYVENKLSEYIESNQYSQNK